MIHEVSLAQSHLIKKFGSAAQVPEGVHVIPVDTFIGGAFMKVLIGPLPDQSMSDFSLFADESLTKPLKAK